MFEGAGNFFSRLGGLLGFGGSPAATPEALNVAGAEYQGAEANPGSTQFREPRPDPFARFSPDQRKALGYASLIDAFGAAAGTPTSAASGLMQTFDFTSGRNQRGGLPQIAQQAPQAMQVAPMMQLQAPPMRMPQMGVQRPGVSSYLLG